MTNNLRDHLLATLATLPGTREFHLHVLVSSPRKNVSLFPFAKPRPRAYVQDILVLLSEQATPDSPRIILTAIEASVYNIPTTSCAVFYVSKVDSTGQSSSTSPTAALVRALLSFYADPATRPVSADHLWIHLFARAQAQYLFPNSAEFSGKHPLNDIKLCAWWKRLLSQVARDIKTTTPDAIIKPFYILPGFNELEAENSLRVASSSTACIDGAPIWVYGHPYSQTDVPLPCAPDGKKEKPKNLGHYIPYFDDDPKSRFLDEIAYTTDGEIKSPVRKRQRGLSSSKSEGDSKKEESVEEKDSRPLGELSKVTPGEFWERMSFRQECVAGAVTGFFTLAISTSSNRELNKTRSTVSPLAPQPGQVSSQINKRIMTTLLTGVEFSTVERSVRATETLESAIKGLCEGMLSIPEPSGKTRDKTPTGGRLTPEPDSSRSDLLVPPSTPPPHGGKGILPEVSPNPFPEPVASLETYHSHIYGSVCVSKPVPARPADINTSSGALGGPHVTVLAARKKKKRAE